MRLIEIVKAGLIANGFDGLYNDSICGCELGDLEPCGGVESNCRGGYKHTHSKAPHDFVIGPSKEKMTDEEIDGALT